jgi:hypothetical protein
MGATVRYKTHIGNWKTGTLERVEKLGILCYWINKQWIWESNIQFEYFKPFEDNNVKLVLT